MVIARSFPFLWLLCHYVLLHIRALELKLWIWNDSAFSGVNGNWFASVSLRHGMELEFGSRILWFHPIPQLGGFVCPTLIAPICLYMHTPHSVTSSFLPPYTCTSTESTHAPLTSPRICTTSLHTPSHMQLTHAHPHTLSSHMHYSHTYSHIHTLIPPSPPPPHTHNTHICTYAHTTLSHTMYSNSPMKYPSPVYAGPPIPLRFDSSCEASPNKLLKSRYIEPTLDIEQEWEVQHAWMIIKSSPEISFWNWSRLFTGREWSP